MKVKTRYGLWAETSEWAEKWNLVEMFLHTTDVTVDCFVQRRQSENPRQCDLDADELFNTNNHFFFF